jgi:hypothetical protein
MGHAALQVRHWGQGLDLCQDLLHAHHEVFGSAVDADWVRWKYGSGMGVGTGLFAGNEMAAFCGGVPRTLWWNGRAVRGLQITDVMVRPAWRLAGRGGGAFAQVSAGLYARQLGSVRLGGHTWTAGSPFELGFGFPSHRHLKLAQKLDLLRDGGPVAAAVWTEAATPVMEQVLREGGHGAAPWVAEECGQEDAVRAAHRAWTGMQQALAGPGAGIGSGCGAIVGDRSAQVLRWRHLEQPAAARPGPVRWLVVRRPWHRDATGVLVWREVPAQVRHHTMWLDWIGPPLMLRQAWAMALRASLAGGAAEMHGWCTAMPWGLLENTSPSGVAEVARLGVPCAGRFGQQELAKMPWWMMAGDTDFL